MKKIIRRIIKKGFTGDDYVEGVFLIKASTQDVFFNRKEKLELLTGFSDGMYDYSEEDGGIWKVITTAHFDSINELKQAIKKAEKFSWLYLRDSWILFEGEDLFSDGEWLV
jgi:hypothetical protein